MSDASLLRRRGVAYAGIPLAEMMAGLIWGWLASMGMGAEARRAQSGMAMPRTWPGDALPEVAVPVGEERVFLACWVVYLLEWAR
jgi:hypothetical protein